MKKLSNSRIFKLVRVGALLTLVVLAVSSVNTPAASAISGTDWRAGKIIDDGVFRSSKTMSPQDIQNFLNSKMPSCDTWGTQPYAGTTRAEYGRSRGNPPPYICLKDYYENVDTKENNLEGRAIPAGAKSAAQIIYDHAQVYSINPQVLLVLLQKEQTLLTDDWPWVIQYKTATGYGCPDTAPCDSQYFGLSNQVRWASRMFQAISDDDPNWYSPYLVGNNYVQWNPISSCGGTNVDVTNKATASLYSYTPYQPNQAALNNLYGTGDSCSSYGNRNFWRLFSEWFGSTTAPNYSWQAAGQTVFTDNTKTSPIGWNARVQEGQRVFVSIRVKNIGNQTWIKGSANPVRIATWNPQDRNSPFCSEWISCNRIAEHVEASVGPGEFGTFEFWAKAPQQSGTYREHFNLVAEGRTWFNPTGTFVEFDVQPPIYTWQPIHQGVFTDNTKTTPIGWNARTTPGQKVYAVMSVRNTGNVAWEKNSLHPVRLAPWNPQDKDSIFCSGWISCNRIAVHNEDVVQPGQIATYEFWIQAPDHTVSARQHVNLVAEGKTWMKPTGAFIDVSVEAPQYSWQPLHQAVFTDNTKTTHLGWGASLAPSQKAYVVVAGINKGNIAWTNTTSPIRLGTWNPQDRNSPFCSEWLSCNRPATLQESRVEPGQVGHFEFWIQAPTSTGTYKEYFNPVAEGKSWMNATGMYVQLDVK